MENYYELSDSSSARIENAYLYDLRSSLIASGYPMFSRMDASIDEEELLLSRGARLGAAPPGSGHDNYLKGIRVSFDITLPQYIWMQMERYMFVDIVSMQSKMHRITQMLEDNDIISEWHTNSEALILLSQVVEEYNNEEDPVFRQDAFLEIIATCPMGLMLTARLSTNYAQLKTIYNQRRYHKLPEWQDICRWIGELPYFKQLVLGGENK